MKKSILLLLLLFSTQSYAITLEEAISTIAKETTSENAANEITIENETYNSTIASAKQTISPYIPNPYLFYTYSNPFNTSFSTPPPSTGAFPTKFITGLIQQNYGFAVEYNILSLPQAVKKIQSVGISKSAARMNMESRKSEFYYNLANIFIELYRADASFNLQQKIYETAKARYSEIRKNAQYGVTSKKDLLMAESDFMQAEMNLEKDENALKNAQVKYKEKFQTLHYDLQITETPITKIAQNTEDLKEKIINNQNIISLNQVAKSYKIESSIEKLNLLPKVTITYRNLFNHPDPSLGFPNYMQTSFAVNANFNLLNINNYFASKKYSHEEKKKKAEAKMFKASYETESVNLWNDARHQEELILVLTKVVQNAKEIYNITKNEVRSGTKPFTEELRAKQDYNTTELSLIEARLKKAQNIQRLKFLTGMEAF